MKTAQTEKILFALLDYQKFDGDAALDALIAETEADIEHLKSLIEQAEARIEDSKQKTSDSSAAIQKEKEAISQLLEFANGVAGKEGAQ